MEQLSLASFKNLFKVLCEHKFKVFLTFIGTFLTILIGTMRQTPIYQTKSTVLIKFGREYMFKSSSVGSVRPSIQFRTDEVLNNAIRIIISKDLIEKVITTIGVAEVYPDLLANNAESIVVATEKGPNSMEKDSDTMEKDSDTMEKDSDTMEKDSDTMEKDSDTMEKDSDTMGLTGYFPLVKIRAYNPDSDMIETSTFEETVISDEEEHKERSDSHTVERRTNEGPNLLTPLLEEAIFQFEESLTVRAVPDSSIIQISFEHHIPKISAEAVNLLIEFYKEKHLQVFSNQHIDFLEKEIISSRIDLKYAEDDLQVFKIANGIYSYHKQKQDLLSQLLELKHGLQASEVKIKVLKRKHEYLQNQSKIIPETVSLSGKKTDSNLMMRAKSRLLELELQERELLDLYTEEQPLVMKIGNQIWQVKDFIDQINDSSSSGLITEKNRVYEKFEIDRIEIEAEIVALETEIKYLAENIEQQELQLKEFDSLSGTMNKITGAIGLREKNYNLNVEELHRARVSEKMDRDKLANIRIIQAARVPLKPIRPNKKLNITIGLFLGLFAGAGVALTSAYWK